MVAPPSAWVRTWLADLYLGWEERIWDPLHGRPACPLRAALRNDPALAGKPVDRELDGILRSRGGRRLSRRVVGDHHQRQSLTDVMRDGASHAAVVLPYLRSDATILEFGGGIGRLGHAIAPHVRRLVSVDDDPLTKEYGRRLSPGVEFLHSEELAESADFDGAYSIAALERRTRSQRKQALEYVHRRLKPGGWFLVVSESTSSAPEELRALCAPLFTATPVPGPTVGVLLRRKDADMSSDRRSADGRYAIDEKSIVFDVVDGQVVVVNLDNGAYYILEGTGSAVWQMLAAGRRVPDITDALLRHYSGERALVERAVTEFVAQLEGESLLTAGSSMGEPPSSFDESQLGGHGEPFSAPVMYRYTDMQALIQMDPIREYDETGWPRRPTVPPAATA